MKLLHLLKMDLKHVAWLLVLNVLLAAAYAFQGTDLADRMVDGARGFSELQKAWPFLMIGYFLITGILTGRLLTKDSLCDVDAFWLSKPIDGWQLLLSKATALVIVCYIIPGTLLWLVANNSGVAAPWGALLRFAYWGGWFVPAIVVFAVHTRGLSTMLVGIIAAAAALALGFVFLNQFQFFGVRPGMGGYFQLIAYVIQLAALTTAIILLYLTRNVSLSRRVAGVGIGAVIIIAAFGLRAYRGPSDRIHENASLAKAIEVKAPVLTLGYETRYNARSVLAKGVLEFDGGAETPLFHLIKVNADFRAPGQRTIFESDRRVSGFVSESTLRRSLAGPLSELETASPESIMNLRGPTQIPFQDRLLVRDESTWNDPNNRWQLTIVLARLAIENCVVIPIEDGREISFGGSRTVLHQIGAEGDYSKFLLIEYHYEDIATSPPISLRESEPVERLYRLYFLKGGSGRLWRPEVSLRNLEFANVFGLEKRVGYLGKIEPLTDGPDSHEEFELVAIDVRHLGNVILRSDATGHWGPDAGAPIAMNARALE